MASQDLSYIRELIHKKRTGTIDDQELAVLQAWERSHPDDELLLDEQYEGKVEVLKEKMYANILAGIQQPPVRAAKPRFRTIFKYAAAAILVMGLVTTGYLYNNRTKVEPVTAAAVITPGSNKAVLTLSDGTQISLSDAAAGKLATNITMTTNGDVVYTAGTAPSSQTQFNTIATPRGGQWPGIVLPDGTRVILDAASSIRYPTQFTGAERLVELSGQAYFEVAHMEKQPFKIKAGGIVIEDIGTAFNVEAYPDESMIRTALVEGSVKVITAEQAKTLVPGDLAAVKYGSTHIDIKKAVMEEVTAWKNGQVSFNGKTVEEIMRQVSRWYDVDVVYEGVKPDRKFSGSISRNVQLKDLLNVLKFQDLHIETEGNRLIVKP
jgi:transmembrane sensor